MCLVPKESLVFFRQFERPDNVNFDWHTVGAQTLGKIHDLNWPDVLDECAEDCLEQGSSITEFVLPT